MKTQIETFILPESFKTMKFTQADVILCCISSKELTKSY